MEQDFDPARKKLRQTTQKLKGEKVTMSLEFQKEKI